MVMAVLPALLEVAAEKSNGCDAEGQNEQGENLKLCHVALLKVERAQSAHCIPM
jgi:hypothetical protein